MANPPIATSDEKNSTLKKKHQHDAAEGPSGSSASKKQTTLQAKRMEPKQTVKRRLQSISPPAGFVPKKRTRSIAKLERLMRETAGRTETVTLDSDSDPESCDSNSAATSPAARSANTATSTSDSRSLPEPSEPLSTCSTAIVGRYADECSAAASSAAVNKEMQPCASSSLGLGLIVAAGGPLAEKPGSVGISKKNKASCLPAEVLLNILHCLDFNTLVALCFTNHLFHTVVQTNVGVLAKRRDMRLFIQDVGVILYAGDARHEIRCNPNTPSTYVNAMKDVASHVGCHKLKTLNVTIDWPRMPMGRLLSAAPALRFVETLRLSIAAPNSASAKSVDDVNGLAAQFPRLRRLGLHAFGPAYFDWSSFLLSEGALKLPELDARQMCGYTREDGSTAYPTELDFLRYCFDCTELPEGVRKFVRHNLGVSRSFLVASLRRVANANRTITVQFFTAEEANLSTEKFSVQRMEQPNGRSVTHYKSRNTGVSAYQQGNFFTITSDPTFDPFAEDY